MLLPDSLLTEETKRFLRNYRHIITIAAFIIVISIVPAVVLKGSLDELIRETSYEGSTVVKLFARIFFYTYSVSLSLFIVQTLSLDSFVADKKDRVFEILLVGPITLKRLWLCKSMAIFIISYVTTMVSNLFFIVVLNLMKLSRGIVLPNPDVWMFVFLLLPLMIFLVTLLSGLLQMTAKRFSSVNFGIFVIAFLLITVPSFLITKIVTSGGMLLFTLYAVITLILLMITILARKLLLRKERIILSL